MKAKLLVEGKEFEIEILDPKLQELIAPAKKTGYERTKYETYYFINGEGRLDHIEDDGGIFDNRHFDEANYYSSKEVAENNARADKLMRQLRRFAVEHRVYVLDWGDEDYPKWSIFYNHNCKRPEAWDCYSEQDFGAIYFDSEETTDLAIETFHDELMWYFTEYKDSL